MVQWNDDHPGEGDSGSWDSSASHLQALDARLETLYTNGVSAISRADATVWTGTAADVWRGAAWDALFSVPDIRTTMSQARAAIVTYGTTVENIRMRAQHWTNERDQADRTVGRVDSTWRAPWDIGGMQDDQREREKAQHAQSHATAQLQSLAEERRAADAAVVAAINKALPASWKGQHDALVAAGITSPKGLTIASVTKAMSAWAKNIRDGRYVSDGDVDRLNAVFDLFGQDRTALSGFFQQLGGGMTVDLINNLGHQVQAGDDGPNGRNAQILALAQRVRSGLSIASSGWGPRLAQEFAAAMLQGDPDRGYADKAQRYDAVGWLFSDPTGAPMGLHLTVAAADLAYRTEKSGQQLINTYPVTDTGGARLWTLEHSSNAVQDLIDGTLRNPADDASGRILETLGQYPDSALAYLSGSDGQAKVDYWFGERSWSLGDQYQGPSALWLGAEHAEGGVWDTSHQDETTLKTQAALASRIIDQLQDNHGAGDFVKASISDMASQSFGAAISPYLDVIAYENQISVGNLQPPDIVSALTVKGANAYAPLVTPTGFDIFMGEVGSHVGGAEVIHQAIASLQQAYLQDGVSDPTKVADALARAVYLQGVLDGSGAQATIEEAQRQDALTDQGIQFAAGVVDLIPIPELSEAVHGGGVLLNTVQDVLVGQAKEHGWDLVGNGLHVTDRVTQAMADRNLDQETRLKVQLLSIEHQLFPTVVPDVAPQAHASDAAFSTSVSKDWYSAQDALARLDQTTTPVHLDLLRMLGGLYETGRDGAAGNLAASPGGGE